MEVLSTAAASAPAAALKRDRSGRKQDRSGRNQVQDRSGRKQQRKHLSGAARRAMAKQKMEDEAGAEAAELAAAVGSAVPLAAGAEAAAAADSAAANSEAADSAAADPQVEYSSAAGSTTVVGSMATDSMAVGSARAMTIGSAVAGSTTVGSLAAGSMIHSLTANASTVIASVSAVDDRDPYVEWGSDSGSSGIGHDGMGGYPMNSDEEEMREAYLRLEDRAACEQNRVRAEIDAADRTASDAQASARPVAVARLAALRAGVSADSDSDWDPDSLVEQMVSDYAIAQLREVIANHRILLGLSLIPVSQLSHSIHNHDRHLELQTTQQSILCEMTGHAVATASIAHAIRAYHSGL